MVHPAYPPGVIPQDSSVSSHASRWWITTFKPSSTATSSCCRNSRACAALYSASDIPAGSRSGSAGDGNRDPSLRWPPRAGCCASSRNSALYPPSPRPPRRDAPLPPQISAASDSASATARRLLSSDVPMLTNRVTPASSARRSTSAKIRLEIRVIQVRVGFGQHGDR